MVTMGALRCGVAQARRHACLAEQAAGLVHEFVEVVESQHLLTNNEQIGNSRAELCQHCCTTAGRLEKPGVDAADLRRVHAVEHSGCRPERPSLVLAED